METNERVLVHYNQPEADKKINSLKCVQKQLQSVSDEFRSLNEMLTIDIVELESMFVLPFAKGLFSPNEDRIKNLIFTKLAPDGKLNGLPISQEKFESIVSLPSLDPLFESIRKTDLSAIGFLRNNQLEINKKGEIVISKNAEFEIIESHKYYVENEIEAIRYNKALALSESVNDIIQHYCKNEPLDHLGSLESVLVFENDKYVPNIDFVKSGKIGSYGSIMELLSVKPIVDEPTPGELSDEYIKTLIEAE